MLQFDTKNQSFQQVMGNNLKYTVPRFQRDYSWGEEQWDDLWQDLHGSSEESSNTAHYMGYLVLQSSNGKDFTVIDGQQRLTTITIIVLSALYELQELVKNNIQSEENQKRMDTLRNSFIGFTDPVSLLLVNRLTLNRNNNGFFQTYLSELQQPPVRKINRSNRLIGKALEYFRQRLKEAVSDQDQKDSGKQIARLIENMANRLYFTTITVDDKANAYTVFETLNARGVQLSTPDLVKNYIFSLIDNQNQLDDSKIENLETQWSNIIHQLGKHKFSDFIKVDWNSKNNFIRLSELFKKIKTQLDDTQKAHNYLKRLQINSEIYSALRDPDDEFWRTYQDGKYNNERLKSSLKTLSMFNIVAPLSALIAAFHKLAPDKFIKFLQYIEVISIRYNVICGRNPSQQEKVYCDSARAIANSSNPSLQTVLPFLKRIYPSDEDFTHAFSTKTFKTQQTHKKARYLLYRMEKHLNKDKNGHIEFDLVTLEHILPVNPTEDWIREMEHSDQAEEWAERIGNFTLISQKKNKEIGRQNFKEKKEFFAKSDFAITKKCAEYDRWNEESILSRQKWLAEQAKDLWRLPDG